MNNAMIRRQIPSVRPATWTGATRTSQLGKRGGFYHIFDDGSVRREPRKLRGKAAVKADKRRRQLAL